jgi:hypothetical protein
VVDGDTLHPCIMAGRTRSLVRDDCSADRFATPC